MNPFRVLTLAAVVIFLPSLARPADATGRRAVARAAAKGAVQSMKRSMARVLRLDRIRDARTPVTPLAEPRTVFRYVTPRRAALELRRGILPGSHVTSRATAGRPLSAAKAKGRFGLPNVRTGRLTVRLPAGTRVRFNKALGGERGVGEISLPQRVEPRAIRKVVTLRPGQGR